MPRRRPSFPALAVGALACAGVIGCARQPEPAPQPTVRRSLTITAQRKQSQRQQDRDKADCQSMANAQATSTESWAQMFTACMGGRGYMVE
jgi:hypothetical protein